MHPFQSQVNNMWKLIKLKIRAQKKESWIEAISLSYTLLEIELRLLLSSKKGASGIPVPPEEIYKQQYLKDLAKVAREKGFIDDTLWGKIIEFNDIRRKAIHRFALGEISYEDLKGPALESTEIMGEIQNCWGGPVKWGPEESFEDWKKANRGEHAGDKGGWLLVKKG
ncbi:MAG: hypothetical protein IMZ61_08555 [Planctomycetes bacterium]|nr:hypothetical protein [Planctomycetota bacterium]